jgi:hypothetical protein
MTSTTAEPQLLEHTVFGAMRRHWLLVSLVVVACVCLALAYGALTRDEYRASATVSAPRPASSALQSDAQYLDSQVLLLSSRDVGDRAFDIARDTPPGSGIERTELEPTVGEVKIIPPTVDSSGSYGTTVVTIEFTAPTAGEAQTGVNALATAYDEARREQIQRNASARLAGIDEALATAASTGDAAVLREERMRALIDRGRDLAQDASISVAQRPEAPLTSGLLSLGLVGLVVGLLLGGVAAYAHAVRLAHVGDASVGRRVYDAPLLYEQPPVDPSDDDIGELTESSRLLGRAVAQALRSTTAPAVLAVVGAPGNASRSATAADLARALAEGERPVLVVDGDDGTLAADLPAQEGSLSVVDLSGPGPAQWHHQVREIRNRVVVVDCPSTATSARAVDLLTHCNAAIVLVRADEPVRDHVEVARWFRLTGTPVLGYVFTPYARGRARLWWDDRRARKDASGQSAAHPVRPTPARPVQDVVDDSPTRAREVPRSPVRK